MLISSSLRRRCVLLTFVSKRDRDRGVRAEAAGQTAATTVLREVVVARIGGRAARLRPFHEFVTKKRQNYSAGRQLGRLSVVADALERLTDERHRCLSRGQLRVGVEVL